MITTSEKQITELKRSFEQAAIYTKSDNQIFNDFTKQGYTTKSRGYAKGSSNFFITMKGVRKLEELGELTESELRSIF